MPYKTTVVSGKWSDGDTEVTPNSIAKAINAVCRTAVSVVSISLMSLHESTGSQAMVAVIVWKDA